jgi:hypothetical protein
VPPWHVAGQLYFLKEMTALEFMESFSLRNDQFTDYIACKVRLGKGLFNARIA